MKNNTSHETIMKLWDRYPHEWVLAILAAPAGKEHEAMEKIMDASPENQRRAAIAITAAPSGKEYAAMLEALNGAQTATETA